MTIFMDIHVTGYDYKTDLPYSWTFSKIRRRIY